MEAYERNLFHSEIYLKLKKAEYQAESTKKRYTHAAILHLSFYEEKRTPRRKESMI